MVHQYALEMINVHSKFSLSLRAKYITRISKREGKQGKSGWPKNGELKNGKYVHTCSILQRT